MPRYLRAPRFDQVRLFAEIGRRLDARGLIASNDGNLSLRDADGSILITASGSRKGYLRPDEVVRVDEGGRVLYGSGKPSSEIGMHLAVYRERPVVGAVVHAHPPVATGFAVAREPLDECILPEIVMTLGSIPIAPYSTPGTSEVEQSLFPALLDHDVLLLANHGAIAVGPDLEEAYFRMERLEHAARILLSARLLGRVTGLQRQDVENLLGAHGPGSTLPCRPSEPG